MKQHEIEPVSLVCGLALLLVAGGFALSDTTDVHLRWLFVVPVVLIVLGFGVLATAARQLSRRDAERATIDDGGHVTSES